MRIPREQVDRRKLRLRAPPAACPTRVACVVGRLPLLVLAMPASVREQRLRLRRERRSEVGDEQREAMRLCLQLCVCVAAAVSEVVDEQRGRVSRCGLLRVSICTFVLVKQSTCVLAVQNFCVYT